MVYSTPISVVDSNLDAFSRLRVSDPSYLFDAQFTYNLQPLLYEPTTGNGGSGTATVAHDATNRMALYTFTGVGDGASAIMQSYEWIPYQPGRSQLFFITFNFVAAATNVLKFVGVGDATNAIRLELNGSTLQASILSGTASTDTVAQSAFNLDRLDGTGPSGVTFSVSKTHILVMDYQALYVGRVRLGLDIGGQVIYFHEFNHANIATVPYIQTASLPIRVGMTASGSATTTMNFICSSAISEGGKVEDTGFSFGTDFAGTAGNTARAHIVSIRPKTTFNSIAERSHFVLSSIDVLVTGNSAVVWELCIGQAISGTTTFNDVNATYSGMEYNTAGAISGSPAMVIASGYCPASATTKGSVTRAASQRVPITLDAAGAVRSLGTLSLIATGLTAASDMRVAFNWIEVR